MAPVRGSMTRSSSSDSSAFSNINVGPVTTAAEAVSDLASATTPPTSVSDHASTRSSKAADEPVGEESTGTAQRPRRARTSMPVYDVKELSRARPAASSREPRRSSTLTGHAPANEEDLDHSPSLGSKIAQALDLNWEVPAASPPRRSSTKLQRNASVRDHVKKAAGKVSSVLGKRTREVMEAGKRKLGLEKASIDPKQKRILRELDTGKKGVLDEIDLDVDYRAPLLPPPPQRPTKRAKTAHAQLPDIAQTMVTGPLQKTSDGKRVKKWQTEGLYVGQEESSDPAHIGQKVLQKTRPSSSSGETAGKRTPFMHLPLFNYLDKTRSFTIPYDIYAPSLRRGDEKPKDWKMLNRNRLVGEAKDLWEKEDRLPASACVCKHPAAGELGCEDDCLNRVMQYECNEDNCRLPPGVCSNRAFAELQARKEKGGSYDVGVEVIKTSKCGFGVRACRSFTPGQIIMEYTGEIISEAECQRRMREEYNDKKCYYLMELERNLVIDGTKGSMARFINHSCDPNCEVRMVKVNGTPRMAVFAGESGIMTGEELNYDYNFDNFGNNQQACHCGAKTCRGYLGKRLNAAEQKKQAKLAEERKRKAAEEAQKLAAAEERKKKAKTARGSNWRGWVAVDDADVKAQLRDEKRQREEAEKNSDRARRLAARHHPGATARRATVHAVPPSPSRTSPRKKPLSRLSETLSRAATTVIQTTSVSITSTSTTEVRHDDDKVSDDATRSRRPAKRSRISLELEDEEEMGEEVAARPKIRRKSLLSDVGSTMKNSVAARGQGLLASTSARLKQSTLSFTRLG